MTHHKLLTTDTIISFDIETTGFIPGVHSIISLGAVAYRNGEEVNHFYGAMWEWKGSVRDDGVMDFWMKHLDEAKQIRKDSQDPQKVMTDFYEWATNLPQPLTLAANPACFDSAMLWWYLHTYCGSNAINDLFKRSRALDIRTFISAIFAVPYSEADRWIVPSEWSEGFTVTHNALDDAREQGVMLMNLLKASVGEIDVPTSVGAEG